MKHEWDESSASNYQLRFINLNCRKFLSHFCFCRVDKGQLCSLFGNEFEQLPSNWPPELLAEKGKFIFKINKCWKNYSSIPHQWALERRMFREGRERAWPVRFERVHPRTFKSFPLLFIMVSIVNKLVEWNCSRKRRVFINWENVILCFIASSHRSSTCQTLNQFMNFCRGKLRPAWLWTMVINIYTIVVGLNFGQMRLVLNGKNDPKNI